MNNKNRLNSLQTILDEIKTDDLDIRRIAEKKIEEDNKKKEHKEIIRRLRIQNKKLLEQLTVVKKKLKQNTADTNRIINKVNYIQKLNNSLSEALGSCNYCWGEDPDCTVCSGIGASGWRDINKRLFNIYILPTLEKLYGLGNLIKSKKLKK